MKSRFPLVATLLLPYCAVAAPSPRTGPAKSKAAKPAPRISVDPAAKQVLERAAKLYGSTPRWSAQISHSSSLDSSASKMTIAFARPSLLKVEDRSGSTTTLEMVDGKKFSSYLKDPDLGNHTKRVDQQRSLSQHLLMAAPAGMADVLRFLLDGKSGLDEAGLKELSADAVSFLVKRLPNASWKGISCQRILLERRYKPTEEDYLSSTLVRDEHWFTPEGKLVKTIAVADGDTWKSEITAQNFAPVFDAKTFAFTP